MATGAMIDYRVRVGPLPVRWRTRITTWEPGRRFADLQEKGPYRFWWHEHTFHADGPRTVMEDRVYLHTAARTLRAAGESPLHPLDTQEDLSVSRRRDPPQIWSVVA